MPLDMETLENRQETTGISSLFRGRICSYPRLFLVEKFPNICKYSMKHFCREPSCIRVVARAMIAIEELQIGCQFVTLLMAEMVTRFVQAEG